MNDKEFTQKAFEDALRATINASKDSASDEEHEAFIKNVVQNNDAIMDAAKMKVELTDRVDIERLAKVVVLSGSKDAFVALTGSKDAFVALTGTLMMICFHIGWKASLEQREEGAK